MVAPRVYSKVKMKDTFGEERQILYTENEGKTLNFKGVSFRLEKG